MNDVDAAIASIGMVSGAAAVILAVAQLTCEHADSPWSPRITSVLLGIIAAWTAIDCWEAWAGADDKLDGKAVAFSVVLALSWGFRRAYGYMTEVRPPPK